MMDSHEKGRVLMNSKNKLLIFLGAYLTVGVAFLCFCRRFMNFSGCSCCGSGVKKED